MCLLTNLYLLYILYIYRQNASVKGAADGTVYQQQKRRAYL